MERCDTIAIPAVAKTMKKLFKNPQNATVSNCVLVWNNDSKSTEVYPISIIDDCITAVKTRLSQLSYVNRCNVIGLCDWVLSCPAHILFDTKRRDDFFVMAFEYTVSRYGAKNVICSVIRFDETIPCVHILFVPVIDNNHLSASGFLTQDEIRTYKSGLREHIAQKFGAPQSDVSAKTDAKRKSSVSQDCGCADLFADEKAALNERERRLARWEKSIELREKYLDLLERSFELREKSFERSLALLEQREVILAQGFEYIQEFITSCGNIGRVTADKISQRDEKSVNGGNIAQGKQ